MTNLEKYPNTADAVKAWSEFNASGNLIKSFVDWLGLDYIEPLNLLESAKAVKRYLDSIHIGNAGGIPAAKSLTKALAAEEARPKRNYERFATADEAYDALMEMCDTRWCESCRFSNGNNLKASRNYNCAIHWLYSGRLDLAKDDGAEHAARAKEKTEEATDGE